MTDPNTTSNEFNAIKELNIDGVDMAEVCTVQEDNISRVWVNQWWTLQQACQLREWLNHALPSASETPAAIARCVIVEQFTNGDLALTLKVPSDFRAEKGMDFEIRRVVKAAVVHKEDCQKRLTTELHFKNASPCDCGAENGL